MKTNYQEQQDVDSNIDSQGPSNSANDPKQNGSANVQKASRKVQPRLSNGVESDKFYPKNDDASYVNPSQVTMNPLTLEQSPLNEESKEEIKVLSQGSSAKRSKFEKVKSQAVQQVLPPVLGNLTRPKSLAPLSHEGGGFRSNQNNSKPQQLQVGGLVIQNDIKIKSKLSQQPTTNLSNIPESQFAPHPQQKPILAQKQRKIARNASIYPERDEMDYDDDEISKSNSALLDNKLVDEEEVKQVQMNLKLPKAFQSMVLDDNERKLIMDAAANADGNVEQRQDTECIIDQCDVSQGETKRRNKFIQEFVNAENFIVPTGRSPTDEQVKRSLQLQQEILKSSHDAFLRDRLRMSQEQREDTKVQDYEEAIQSASEFKSIPLKVLSSHSFYIHESILYSLEIRPDFENQRQDDSDYYGTDKEFCQEYHQQSKDIPISYQNHYEELKKFGFIEYNILDMELTQEYKFIKSRVQISLYHMPQLIKIKTINLPLSYLNSKTNLSVSSAGNIQVFSNNAVLFITLQGKFIDQNTVQQSQSPSKNLRVTFAGVQSSFNQSQISQGRQSESYSVKKADQKSKESIVNSEIAYNNQFQHKVKKYVETASFKIICYKPIGSQDRIIFAAQLGSRDPELQKIIITKNFWLDAHNLPNMNQFTPDYDENQILEIKNVYISNSRSLVLESSTNNEYYIFSKDDEKLRMLETNLGNEKDMRKQKRKTQSDKDDIVYSSIFYDQIRKVHNHQINYSHLTYFTVKRTQKSQPLNSSYKVFRFLKNGGYEVIDLGTVKEAQMLRLIYNFENQEKTRQLKIDNDFSIEQLFDQSILSLSYRCRLNSQVYSFDLEKQKFSVYSFDNPHLTKYKSQLIVDTGPSSECGFHSQFEKHMICVENQKIITCLALKREDIHIFEILSMYAANYQDKKREIGITKSYLNYFTKRSQYGSLQIQRDDQGNTLENDMAKLVSQTSLKKSASFSRQKTFKFDKQQSKQIEELEDEGDEISSFKKIQASEREQALKHSKATDYHLNQLIITETKTIFDLSQEMINHLRYQIKMGLVSGIFQQRVAYNPHHDKYNSPEEIEYHRILKVNSEFIWKACVKKNYVIIYKLPTQETLLDDSHQLPDTSFTTFKLKDNYLIREVNFSADNDRLIIISQSVQNPDLDEKERKLSILIDLTKDIEFLSEYQIEDIRSVASFSKQWLQLIVHHKGQTRPATEAEKLKQKCDVIKEEDQTHFVGYEFNPKDGPILKGKFDITQLLKQDKYLEVYSYNQYKPQSCFHFTYRNKYLILNMDYSYYMIFEKKFIGNDRYYEYLNSFEFEDKNFFLLSDQNQLYIINSPVSDTRQKKIPQVSFHEGLIESVLRLSIQQIHVVINFSEGKFVIEDSEQQEITYVKIYYPGWHKASLLHSQNQLTNFMNDYDLVRYIQDLNQDDLISFYDTYSSSFLHQVWLRNQKVLDTFQKRLTSLNSRQIPLIFMKNSQNQTVLDLAVEFGDFFKINIILDVLIKYQGQTHLNEVIDRHINYMLEHKFNLKEYFESELPMQRIQNVNYPNYSKDNSTFVYGEFENHHTINYIWNNYSNMLGKHVDELNNKGQVQVEYYFLNIPHTIRNKNFIKNLSSIPDIELYETLAIQTVLDYKWDKFAKNYALMHFFLYIGLFLITYSVDIYLFIIKGEERTLEELIITKIFCLIYIVILEVYEFRLVKKIGFSSYVEDKWNYADQLFCALYIACVVVDFTGATPLGLTIMQCVMCFFVFVKLCSTLRVFEGFSFQMSMLRAVFVDIRYFISLYSFVLGVYGYVFSLLKIPVDDPENEGQFYSNVSYFGYFIMSFSASVGDSQVDNLYQLPEQLVLFAWLIYISAVLFLNVIMLNFIIAVIGESYSKVMQRMTAESYSIKCMLIKERESYFNRKFTDKKYFPKYLILRRPVLGKQDEDVDWQGFIKDLKRTINNSAFSQISQVKSHMEHVKQDIFEKLQLLQKEQHTKQDNFEQNMRFYFFEAIKQMSDKQADLNKKMDSIISELEEQKQIQAEVQQRIDLGLEGPNIKEKLQSSGIVNSIGSSLRSKFANTGKKQSVSKYDLEFDKVPSGKQGASKPGVVDELPEEEDQDCEATE